MADRVEPTGHERGRPGVPQRPPVSSFVVRIWREGQSAEAPTWRAQVDHVQSGTRRTFGDLAEILDFMRGCLQDPGSGDPDLVGRS